MKKFCAVLAFMLAVCGVASGQGRIVCDETCKQEAFGKVSSDSVSVNYAVVSPVGRGTVEMIKQAPRLSTLEGKTIAVVGGSFMASVTHPEIKRLILEHYPSAKVLLLEEIGSAGVFPAPGVVRRSKEEFTKRLREQGVDAVISGNCGCGLCTPKECGSCIAAEYIGIPAVAIAAPTFVNQVFYTSLNNGVPAPRVVEYPGAFASHTHDELIHNTRNVLWPQIVKALISPITEEEIARNTRRDKGDIRDDVFYGTIDEVNAHFREQRWSDGLPIVPPTFERVSEFMHYTDMAWNETVAVLPVAHRNTTAWHVAVNGVMAGCKPEYMPLLIALTKAIGAGEFRRTIASTHAWIPYCWFNGPVARQLGIASGEGEISDVANVAIGRFMNLALQNLAGYYVGENRMGTFGYPMPWCLVEDEAACLAVGWKPYHVREGFALNDNTITVSSTLLWGNNMAPSTTNPQKIMELLAWDISERCQFALGSGRPSTHRTVLMTPPIARNLAEGYKTPTHLEKALIRTARRPLDERVFANYYANPGRSPEGRHSIQRWKAHISRTEGAEITATPVWHAASDKEMMTLPTMQEGMTVFLVTGDSSRNKIQTMPGGGYKSVAIELPKAWDKLTSELGYAPLKEFYVK